MQRGLNFERFYCVRCQRTELHAHITQDGITALICIACVVKKEFEKLTELHEAICHERGTTLTPNGN